MGLDQLDQVSPSLILLDFMMPEMDRFWLMEALQQRQDGNKHVAVIVITGKI